MGASVMLDEQGKGEQTGSLIFFLFESSGGSRQYNTDCSLRPFVCLSSFLFFVLVLMVNHAC